MDPGRCSTFLIFELAQSSPTDLINGAKKMVLFSSMYHRVLGIDRIDGEEDALKSVVFVGKARLFFWRIA
ncbi:unnamed protein product [Heligmosomoides polygyrus]|uniref:Dirigent protein n=1 Tax=Heligmosomoides polygyrus TaxID=6339 RepID=A0A183GUA8_HELPZ|nr:unnamed protein product [Heligmosomoides polygyrus]